MSVVAAGSSTDAFKGLSVLLGLIDLILKWVIFDHLLKLSS